MEEQHKKWKNTKKNGWTTRKLKEQPQGRWTYLLTSSLINQGSRYHMMSPSSRVRKLRRSHAELMKLPWRRMKVRKLEEERRSGATMVFGEALKWGWANTQGRRLEETKTENSSLSWFTKREEPWVISTEFLYYIHDWKYKGPKLSIYRLKWDQGVSKKVEGKRSLESWFWSQKGACGRCDLPPKQFTLVLPWEANSHPWRASLRSF